MAGKKSSPKKNTEAPLTKADLKAEMVNYIGPIFEELKNDIRTMTGSFDQKLQSVPKQILHEMTILLERDDRLNALSDFGKTGEINTEKIGNLEGRVTHLEKDVEGLKIAKTP